MSFYDLWSAVMISAIAGCVLVFSALIGSRLLAPFARERGKGISYECGMLPIGRNWAQVHVRWAITFLSLPMFVFYEMLVFIAVLALGLAYAWKRGVLEWK
mgnify:CR=1 FL=1